MTLSLRWGIVLIVMALLLIVFARKKTPRHITYQEQANEIAEEELPKGVSQITLKQGKQAALDQAEKDRVAEITRKKNDERSLGLADIHLPKNMGQLNLSIEANPTCVVGDIDIIAEAKAASPQSKFIISLESYDSNGQTTPLSSKLFDTAGFSSSLRFTQNASFSLDSDLRADLLLTQARFYGFMLCSSNGPVDAGCKAAKPVDMVEASEWINAKRKGLLPQQTRKYDDSLFFYQLIMQTNLGLYALPSNSAAKVDDRIRNYLSTNGVAAKNFEKILAHARTLNQAIKSSTIGLASEKRVRVALPRLDPDCEKNFPAQIKLPVPRSNP